MQFDPLYLNNAIAALDQTSARQQQLTNEISSGSRINSLSDDPVAAGENSFLSSQLALDDSFSQTESSTVGKLQVADTTLGSVVSQLTKALTLATEGDNGTLNASDLRSVATQLSGIRDEVLSLANTTYTGQYIFSGSQGGTSPFTLNTGTPPAADTVTYNGDESVSYILTPSGQKIQSNLPGDVIFANPSDPTTNVLQVLNQLVADFASGTPSTTSIADTTSLNSALNYVGQQRVVLDNSITQLQSAQTYTQAQSTQLIATQTNLLQTDVGTVSTQLSLAETQQAALTQVVNLLENNNGDLFSLL